MQSRALPKCGIDLGSCVPCCSGQLQRERCVLLEGPDRSARTAGGVADGHLRRGRQGARGGAAERGDVVHGDGRQPGGRGGGGAQARGEAQGQGGGRAPGMPASRITPWGTCSLAGASPAGWWKRILVLMLRARLAADYLHVRGQSLQGCGHVRPCCSSAILPIMLAMAHS